MKHKLAYIIDFWSTNSAHEVINFGYLMMISEIYEKVVYVANKSSINNLNQFAVACGNKFTNVEFIIHEIKQFSIRPGCLSGLLNALFIGYKGNTVYRNTPKGADVFYNNNFHFTCLYNKWLKGSNNNVFYLCHAEMELIQSAKDRGYFAHLFKYYLKYMYEYSSLPDKTKIILLSEGMAQSFKQLISKKNQYKIFGMDHCYIRPMSNAIIKDIDYNGIKIGIPGSITKERGLDTLKGVLSAYSNSNAKIFSISSISEHIENDKFEIVNKTNKQLPFEEYAGYVHQMDAFLFLYDINSYQLSASGALLEAIWNEKPIIALKNAYFEYMFNKFGPMGYLVDSVDDLINIINNLTISNIDSFKENIIKAKERLLPQNVTKSLKDIIDA